MALSRTRLWSSEHSRKGGNRDSNRELAEQPFMLQKDRDVGKARPTKNTDSRAKNKKFARPHQFHMGPARESRFYFGLA